MTKPRSVAATANDNSTPGSRIEDGTISSSKLSSDLSNNLIISPKDFGATGDTVQDLLALEDPSIDSGTLITVEEGFKYEVLEASSASFDLLTAGGVKLLVMPGNQTLDWLAFGVRLDVEEAQNAAVDLFLSALSTRSYGIMAGNVYIEAPYNMNVPSGTTLTISSTFTTLNTSDVGVVLTTGGSTVSILGNWSITCGSTGSSLSAYNSRRQKTALEIVQGARMNVSAQITANGTKRNGVVITASGSSNNLNMCSFSSLRASRCGTFEHPKFELTPSSIVNTGSSSNQRSVFTFDADVPETLEPDDLLYLGDSVFVSVSSISENRREVTCIFGLADLTIRPVTFCIGAGVTIAGNNANVIGVGLIDVTVSGVGARLVPLLGATIDRIHSSLVSVGAVIGNAGSSANVGGTIGLVYREGGTRHILEAATNASNWSVLTGNSSGAPIDHIKLDATTAFLPVRVSSRNLILDENIEVLDAELGGSGPGLWGHRTFRRSLRNSGGRRYLTLCRSNTDDFCGYFKAVATPTDSSVRQKAALVEVQITGGTGNPPNVFWNVTGTNNSIKLVTLDYEGENWICLDQGEFGSNADNSMFRNSWAEGLVQDFDFTWLVWNTVSNVQTLAPSSYSTRFGQPLESSSLRLKSPNGTVWDVTVDDSGNLSVS